MCVFGLRVYDFTILHTLEFHALFLCIAYKADRIREKNRISRMNWTNMTRYSKHDSRLGFDAISVCFCALSLAEMAKVQRSNSFVRVFVTDAFRIRSIKLESPFKNGNEVTLDISLFRNLLLFFHCEIRNGIHEM